MKKLFLSALCVVGCFSLAQAFTIYEAPVQIDTNNPVLSHMGIAGSFYCYSSTIPSQRIIPLKIGATEGVQTIYGISATTGTFFNISAVTGTFLNTIFAATGSFTNDVLIGGQSFAQLMSTNSEQHHDIALATASIFNFVTVYTSTNDQFTNALSLSTQTLFTLFYIHNSTSDLFADRVVGQLSALNGSTLSFVSNFNSYAATTSYQLGVALASLSTTSVSIEKLQIRNSTADLKINSLQIQNSTADATINNLQIRNSTNDVKLAEIAAATTGLTSTSYTDFAVATNTVIKVNRVGDTMTGDLIISKSVMGGVGPTLRLSNPAGGGTDGNQSILGFGVVDNSNLSTIRQYWLNGQPHLQFHTTENGPFTKFVNHMTIDYTGVIIDSLTVANNIVMNGPSSSFTTIAASSLSVAGTIQSTSSIKGPLDSLGNIAQNFGFPAQNTDGASKIYVDGATASVTNEFRTFGTTSSYRMQVIYSSVAVLQGSVASLQTRSSTADIATSNLQIARSTTDVLLNGYSTAFATTTTYIDLAVSTNTTNKVSKGGDVMTGALWINNPSMALRLYDPTAGQGTVTQDWYTNAFQKHAYQAFTDAGGPPQYLIDVPNSQNGTFLTLMSEGGSGQQGNVDLYAGNIGGWGKISFHTYGPRANSGVDLTGSYLLNLATPTSNSDGANKGYVDNLSTSAFITLASTGIALNKLQIRSSTSDVTINNLQLWTSTTNNAINNLQLRNSTADVATNNLQIQNSTTDLKINNLQVRNSTADLAVNNLQIRNSTADVAVNNLQIRTSTSDVQISSAIYGGWLGGSNTNYVNVAGSTMTGNLSMSGNYILGLATPTTDTQAANKWYIDKDFIVVVSTTIKTLASTSSTGFTTLIASTNFLLDVGTYSCRASFEATFQSGAASIPVDTRINVDDSSATARGVITNVANTAYRITNTTLNHSTTLIGGLHWYRVEWAAPSGDVVNQDYQYGTRNLTIVCTRIP